MTYFSQIFSPLTLSQAKHIVLTPDSTKLTKFEDDTDFLVNFILNNKLITEFDKVLDFGCGMGRISKPLIEKIGCTVIGLDTSLHMQIHAINYVNNDKFDTVICYNTKDINVVIASLVLQHVENPQTDINNIYNMLISNGILILLDENIRYVPVGVDNDGYVKWYNDGINIIELVSKQFNCIGRYDYPNTTTKPLSVWRKSC